MECFKKCVIMNDDNIAINLCVQKCLCIVTEYISSFGIKRDEII